MNTTGISLPGAHGDPEKQRRSMSLEDGVGARGAEGRQVRVMLGRAGS